MIQIRDVTKTHMRGETEVRALRGVTCEIERGSFSFIVGPSGSGKSSLLYLIGALDEPTSGEITVDGKHLAGLSSAERDEYRRSDVGFIFQSFNLLSNLTAVENVLVPFLPRGVSQELRGRAVEFLGRVGLSGRLEHRPCQLSGGEQQRVAIARRSSNARSSSWPMNPPANSTADPARKFSLTCGNCTNRKTRPWWSSPTTSAYITDGDRIITLQDGRIFVPSPVREEG